MILVAEMKRLQGKGRENRQNHYQMKIKRKLWTSGQLGSHCPQALVDTTYVVHVWDILRTATWIRAQSIKVLSLPN